MDGVRAYWDGKRLLSRNVKKFSVPSHFKSELPSLPLDGELWMGRGTFEELISNINLKKLGNWNDIGYYIFDLPSSSAPYYERYNQMRQLKLPKHVHIVSSTECTGKFHLEMFLDEILKAGGEGVIARDPHSLYASGLTSSLLKVKVQ